MKEKLKTELQSIKEQIGSLKSKRETLIKDFIDATAKFKVGDKVFYKSQIGYIYKVEFTEYFVDIKYQVSKQKKDGSMSTHIMKRYVSENEIKPC